MECKQRKINQIKKNNQVKQLEAFVFSLKRIFLHHELREYNRSSLVFGQCLSGLKKRRLAPNLNSSISQTFAHMSREPIELSLERKRSSRNKISCLIHLRTSSHSMAPFHKVRIELFFIIFKKFIDFLKYTITREIFNSVTCSGVRGGVCL